jgi:hypothetical protein
MKKLTLTTNARAARLAPRNPFVAAAHQRHAGPHGGMRKSERQRARREIGTALRQMHEGP